MGPDATGEAERSHSQSPQKRRDTNTLLGRFARTGDSVTLRLPRAALVAAQKVVPQDPAQFEPVGRSEDAAQRNAEILPLVVDADPDLPLVKALRGKKIGINSFGSSADYAAYAAISRSGMDPNKDLTILAIGGGTPEPAGGGEWKRGRDGDYEPRRVCG